MPAVALITSSPVTHGVGERPLGAKLPGGAGPRHGLLIAGRARAELYVVAQLDKLAAKRLADGPGAQHSDPQRDPP
jgi:hypothetical protein